MVDSMMLEAVWPDLARFVTKADDDEK